MFEAIGVAAIIYLVVIFGLIFNLVIAVSPIIWIIYAILVVLIVVYNVVLIYNDDFDIKIAFCSAVIIAVLTFIAKIIDAVSNWFISNCFY